MEESEFRRQLLELYPEIMHWATRYRSSTEQPEDLAQDTVLLALKSWETFNPARSMKTWVGTILTNRFKDLARKAKRRTSSVYIDQDLVSVSAPANQHLAYELREARIAIRSIPSELGIPLILSAHEWNHTEIAHMLECPVGTIKSRIRKAKRVLREELAL